MISISNLQHRYDNREVLNISEWQVPQGQHYLLNGPSGSGKTTLLHILAGLLRPQKGEVISAGQNLSSLSASKLDRFRSQNISLLMQKLYLISALTVRQNLLLAARLSKASNCEERLARVLKALNLEKLAAASIRNLSFGEAQRVAIARSVMNSPALILADEPTSSLDDANCKKVITLLIEQASEYKATLLIATHDSRLNNYISQSYKLEHSEMEHSEMEHNEIS